MSTYGPSYEERLDGKRIAKQHEAIRDYMLTAGWCSLSKIATVLGYPESSVSAQLRHLRKERFGSHIVDKKREGNQWLYRVLEPTTENQQTNLW